MRTIPALCFGFLLILDSCGSPDFSFGIPPTHSLHRIALLLPGKQSGYVLSRLTGSVTDSLFDIVGSANVPADFDARVTQAMNAQGLNPQAEFTTALKANLESAGYEVTIEDIAHPTPDNLVNDYTTVGKNVDGVLDVSMAAMLLDSTLGPYQPVVLAQAKLTDMSDDRVLFELWRGLTSDPGMRLKLPVDAGAQYHMSVDEILNDPVKLAEGFRIVSRKAAAYVTAKIVQRR